MKAPVFNIATVNKELVNSSLFVSPLKSCLLKLLFIANHWDSFLSKDYHPTSFQKYFHRGTKLNTLSECSFTATISMVTTTILLSFFFKGALEISNKKARMPTCLLRYKLNPGTPRWWASYWSILALWAWWVSWLHKNSRVIIFPSSFLWPYVYTQLYNCYLHNFPPPSLLPSQIFCFIEQLNCCLPHSFISSTYKVERRKWRWICYFWENISIFFKKKVMRAHTRTQNPKWQNVIWLLPTILLW